MGPPPKRGRTENARDQDTLPARRPGRPAGPQAAPGTVGAMLRARREEASLTQRALATLVAAERGEDADAWCVYLSRYESGGQAPPHDRVQSILCALGLDARARATAGVSAVLTVEVVTDLVESCGVAEVADAIADYARLLGLMRGMGR